jgi:hypothetical protein
MATINGTTTHIQTVFSFWTGTNKHFIGNALCSSDGSVTRLIHILHLVTIISVFYKTPEETIQSQIWRIRGRRERILLFLSNDQETPCPEGQKRDGRSGMVHHVTGELSPRDMTQCSVLRHSQSPWDPRSPDLTLDVFFWWFV